MNTNNTTQSLGVLFLLGSCFVLIALSCGSPHYRENKVIEYDPPEKFEPIPIERANGVFALLKQPSEHSEIELEAQPSIRFNNLREIRKDFIYGLYPYIEIRLNKEDSQKFLSFTKANIGKQIAIVVENQIVAMPTVMAGIAGGRFSIAAGYTEDEVDKMIELLKKEQ